MVIFGEVSLLEGILEKSWLITGVSSWEHSSSQVWFFDYGNRGTWMLQWDNNTLVSASSTGLFSKLWCGFPWQRRENGKLKAWGSNVHQSVEMVMALDCHGVAEQFTMPTVELWMWKIFPNTSWFQFGITTWLYLHVLPRICQPEISNNPPAMVQKYCIGKDWAVGDESGSVAVKNGG